MSTLTDHTPRWNEEALASLHERYKDLWYPQRAWRELMNSDDLAGVEMTDKMLAELGSAYRWKDGGTDYENGSGDWVPISRLWGTDKRIGVLRQDDRGIWTHHPISEVDREAAKAIIDHLDSAQLKGYQLHLVRSEADSLDSEFDLIRAGRVLGSANRRQIQSAIWAVTDRHTLFAQMLDIERSPHQRIINSTGDHWNIIISDGEGHKQTADKDKLTETIEEQVAQLKALGGGELYVDDEPVRLIEPDQDWLVVPSASEGLVKVIDQDGRTKFRLKPDELIDTVVSAMRERYGSGTLTLMDGTIYRVRENGYEVEQPPG